MPHLVNQAAWIAATSMLLLVVELFVCSLIAAGYPLATALTAATVVSVITAEVTARLLGGSEPSSPAPPQLPGSSW
jgi:hypothetical protein